MTNRLAAASSPYLLQHKDNPVDWYEWGQDAFAAARLRDVPILLSVGYSSCHWCHVMAHESFEDPDTATFMNRHFVNVKVDREERPDVDRIYMDAVQAMTGHGGWPMTCFLTPSGEPFFAGTYFPREPRGNYPSFMQVMTQIVQAWRDSRESLTDQAARLTAAVRAGLPAQEVERDAAVVRGAVAALGRQYDWEEGGFGSAPKFPQAPNLELLMRAGALGLTDERGPDPLAMLTHALDRMAAGGIYDHLGGGFARYAVDRRWLVPHFEKMLYDNALLARIYLRAWQLSADPDHLRVARETLDYLLRDMRDVGGGLHAAEDADSEGVEGKFYVWPWEELVTVAGPDAETAAVLYGAHPEGHFAGANILHRQTPREEVVSRLGVSPAELDDAERRIRAALLEKRSTRIRPGRDDKVITAWNGLAVRALAEAGRVLDDHRYLEAAAEIAEFLTSELVTEGRLHRSWRGGTLGPEGFCDDYAAVAVALFTLYQATGALRWYQSAERLTREMIRLFRDDAGGFYATAADAEALIARPKNVMDNPTPSDNALAAEALLLLAAYTGERDLRVLLDGVYRATGRLVDRYPAAAGHLLAVLATDLAPVREVAIVGHPNRRRALEDVVWERFRPECVLASGDAANEAVPLLVGRGADGEAAAHVCREFVCDLPVTHPDALRDQLRIGTA